MGETPGPRLNPHKADRTLQLAVIGAGAFGRNHIRVYRELARAGYPVALAAIVDPEPAARAGAAVSEEDGPGDDGPALSIQARDAPGQDVALHDVAIFESIAALLTAHRSGQVPLDAASVCVPTSAHFAVASALLSAGIDVLLEKPIAASLVEADALVSLAASSQRILQVGHLERFNPAVIAIQPFLNRPMFFEAHRLSIFTPRSLDVDVVLDLMIHDLDIVLSMTRSPVRDLRAVGLPILSRKVDIANVRVEFESGCVANFTASRVSTELVRKLRFFQPRQYVSIDYARKDLLVIDVAPGGQAAHAAARPAPDAALSFSKPTVSDGEPLRLEIESFLECVRSRSIPRVTREDGRTALALALQINEAMASHAARAGLDQF